MNYLQKIVCIAVVAVFAVGSVHAQRKKKPVKAKTTTSKPAAKKDEATTELKSSGDTSAPKMVTITSAFKPFLKDAAKVNFTAATPVIDSSKIPVAYTIPSQNLFFLYQPVAIKPLALAIDSGYMWENDQYVKVGAGNFSTFFGEAAFSFGDGKNSITNVRGNFLTSTGSLPAQQAAKWGIDLLTIFNTQHTHEWTAHPYYKSTTQYLYGSALAATAAKESLLRRYTTVGLDVGMQNKGANSFGITYHPQISVNRFFDNNENRENNIVVKAPINKVLGKTLSFNLSLNADISTAVLKSSGTLPTNTYKNNLYSINPAIIFVTPDVKINAGIRPSWDNKAFSLLPDFSAEAKFAEINLTMEAGWIGSFQKNTFQSLANYNPYNDELTPLTNTKINETYAGVKGTQGNHFTYQARVSLLQLNNQPLFVNSVVTNRGQFAVLYEPEMKALRLHGEVSYTVQEKLSVTAGATFTQYNSLTLNEKAWGLPPVEATGSLKWKVLKDLQVKADAFLWDGNPTRTGFPSLVVGKTGAVADINLGAEFTVMPKLNLWLQMNNLLNSTYQRWNLYPVLGFNVLGGVVYSFR